MEDREHDDPLGPLIIIMRFLCLIVAFVVFLCAAYYAVQVFTRVAQLIADPGSAGKSVDSIAAMIDAGHLKVVTKDNQTVAVGKTMSFAFLVMIYALWAWIPMGLLRVSGKIILNSMPRRERDREKRQS